MRPNFPNLSSNQSAALKPPPIKSFLSSKYQLLGNPTQKTNDANLKLQEPNMRDINCIGLDDFGDFKEAEDLMRKEFDDDGKDDEISNGENKKINEKEAFSKKRDRTIIEELMKGIQVLKEEKEKLIGIIQENLENELECKEKDLEKEK
jgi:hypothetical protein